MNPITGTITAVCNAFTSFMNWTMGRSTLKNAADVKAAQARQDEANATVTTNEAIKKQDTREIQNELAE